MNLLTKIYTTSFFTSAIFTLVMSPVALGAQAEKQKQEIDAMILAAGLNKSQSYESFWSKNKGDFHGQVYKPLKDYFEKYPNAKMPTFKTTQTKNSLGETVNNIEMALDGKTLSFQYIGEKDKFLKYKSTYLSESDVINFNQALSKMIKVDPELYKEFNETFQSTPAEVKSAQDRVADTQYVGMPRISKETWSKMSQVDRANYLINLRSYWTDSLNVLRQIEKNEQRLRGVKAKTSKYDYLMKFMQNEATAQDSGASTPPPPVVPGGSSSSSPSPSSSMNGFRKNPTSPNWMSTSSSSKPSGAQSLDIDGYLQLPTLDMSTFKDTGTTQLSGQQTSSKTPGNQNCVIHGVISQYVGGSCTKDINTLKKFYSSTNDKEIFKAIETCEKQNPTMMACNPYLYGYQTPGQPHCVKHDRDVNSPYQKATHADGPCEEKSPLGNSLAKENLNGSDFLIKDIKGPGRYADENLKKDVNLEELYKKQQAENDKYVTDYLKSFLGNDVDKIKKGVVLDNDLVDKLSNIQNVFDSQIKFARESCIKSNENPKYKQYDKNFWGACDQLQRRHLFIAQWLEQKVGCQDGGKIDAKTLKCMCPPSQVIKVNPGEKCAAKPPVAPGGSTSVTPPSVVQTVDCEGADQFPGAGAVADEKGVCKCPADGKTPHKLTNSYRGDKYSCESGSFNWKPLLWIGGIIGGAWLLSKLWPKKKKIQPPADTCKLTANCTPQCKTNEELNPVSNTCWPKTEGGTGTNTTDTNAGGVPAVSTGN